MWFPMRNSMKERAVWTDFCTAFSIRCTVIPIYSSGNPAHSVLGHLDPSREDEKTVHSSGLAITQLRVRIDPGAYRPHASEIWLATPASINTQLCCELTQFIGGKITVARWDWISVGGRAQFLSENIQFR